jgi:multidrug efflux pump subunit AcrB
MKLNLKQEDFKLITIGFLPALFSLYVVYLLAYFFWWIPFLIMFPALSWGLGTLLEEQVMVVIYWIEKNLKKALDK